MMEVDIVERSKEILRMVTGVPVARTRYRFKNLNLDWSKEEAADYALYLNSVGAEMELVLREDK